MAHHPILSKTHINANYLSFFKHNRTEIPSIYPWYTAVKTDSDVKTINKNVRIWSTYDTRCFIPFNENPVTRKKHR